MAPRLETGCGRGFPALRGQRVDEGRTLSPPILIPPVKDNALARSRRDPSSTRLICRQFASMRRYLDRFTSPSLRIVSPNTRLSQGSLPRFRKVAALPNSGTALAMAQSRPRPFFRRPCRCKGERNCHLGLLRHNAGGIPGTPAQASSFPLPKAPKHLL